MNTLDRAGAYLTIPQAYTEAFGLRWSHRRDAVEDADEKTLVLAEELRSILDGVFASPLVPPFAFVLALLDAMKRDRLADFARLRRAFDESRGGVGGRNVGLLIAELCRELPPTPGGLTGADVTTALQYLRFNGEHPRTAPAQEPPLTPAEFNRRVADRLAGFTDDDLWQWLAHGTGPSPAGRQLATAIESLPVRVAQLLALARRRPRLVGAAALVAAVDAALSLPPRRRAPGTPQGGYYDVTTRGEPERLLPSQFALDPDEFVRRFAARELLYFQREEPHQAERPERVIVLDQGVRTWGAVRLALAAAAFSLLSADPRRSGRARFFLTSTHVPVDVAECEAGAIANLLEASDLSPNPGECLSRVLQTPDAGQAPRDVILLTHPRNLREPAVIAAIHPLRPADRLFALTVDEAGRAELVEWRKGPVRVRSFRVDLVAAEAARVEGDPVRSRPSSRGEPAWAGSREPIPFAFRPGLVAEPQVFGFDADGDWLVVASRGGVLHGLALDGSPPAVLPRAFADGSVLTQVEAIRGVTGGVVVCGRMRTGRGSSRGWSTTVTYTSADPVLASSASEPAPEPERFVAAYYDRGSHRVALHVLGPAAGTARWYAYPELHCVAVRTSTGWGTALDLATGGRFHSVAVRTGPGSGPTPGSAASNLAPRRSDPGLVSRARAAWDRSEGECPSPHELPVVHAPVPLSELGWDGPWLVRRNDGHYLLRRGPGGQWCPLPELEGAPLFGGADIYRAQLAGDVLAVSFGRVGERRLALVRYPDLAVLGYVSRPVRDGFALSADGKLLARRDVARTVVVSESADPGRALAAASHAGLHNALDVRLDSRPFRLTVAVGTFAHTFRLFESQLRYELALGWDQFPDPEGAPVPQPPPAGYDPARFPAAGQVASGTWRAVLDRLGQVLLFAEGVLVAAFVVRRERAAAWVPGDMFWGDPALIGGPPTPGADRKIGRAILAAGG